MSPKILEIRLSLTLLVLRVGADNAHHAAPMNHLALVANLFYRCPYFHDPSSCKLLIAVDDAAARQIVRRKLHGYFVSRENTNKIFAHLAGNVRQHLMLILQLHSKHGVRQRLNHRGHNFDGVLLGIAGVAFLFFIAKLLRHSLLFSSLTRTGPLHLSASSESRGRLRLPRRCARNAPRGCHPPFLPPTHRACALPDVPHSPSARRL